MSELIRVHAACAADDLTFLYFINAALKPMRHGKHVTSLFEIDISNSIREATAEQIQNCHLFLLLLGNNTRYSPSVLSEVDIALSFDKPIVVCNLYGYRKRDPKRCLPSLKDVLALHVSREAAILGYAIQKWPSRHNLYKCRGTKTPHYYKDAVYERLGL